MYKVAVYGSLRKGLYNHCVMEPEESTYIETVRCAVDFDMVSYGAYPALVPGNSTITFEVYEVTPELLRGGLDSLEGYPHFYDRKLVTLGEHSCWVYFIPSKDNDDTPVPEGDWYKYYTL